jgi:hypothetical protein
MKPSALLIVLAFVAGPAMAADLPPGHPSVDTTKGGGAPTNVQSLQKGTVLSAIDVPQYTYLEVKQGNKTLWLAASTVKAKKGDVIRFDEGMTMTNFHSKTLNRTFPSIQFVSKVMVTNEKP